MTGPVYALRLGGRSGVILDDDSGIYSRHATLEAAQVAAEQRHTNLARNLRLGCQGPDQGPSLGAPDHDWLSMADHPDGPWRWVFYCAVDHPDRWAITCEPAPSDR